MQPAVKRLQFIQNPPQLYSAQHIGTHWLNGLSCLWLSSAGHPQPGALNWQSSAAAETKAGTLGHWGLFFVVLLLYYINSKSRERGAAWRTRPDVVNLQGVNVSKRWDVALQLGNLQLSVNIQLPATKKLQSLTSLAFAAPPSADPRDSNYSLIREMRGSSAGAERFISLLREVQISRVESHSTINKKIKWINTSYKNKQLINSLINPAKSHDKQLIHTPNSKLKWAQYIIFVLINTFWKAILFIETSLSIFFNCFWFSCLVLYT